MSERVKIKINKKRILTSVRVSDVISLLPTVLVYIEKERFENAVVLMVSFKLFNVEWINAIKIK